MMFYRLREMGWKLAAEKNYKNAIACFEQSIKAGVDKYIDHREMAWMHMELDELNKSQFHYEAAFKENPSDPHILRGLTYLYLRKRMKPEFDHMKEEALKVISDDEELKSLIF